MMSLHAEFHKVDRIGMVVASLLDRKIRASFWAMALHLHEVYWQILTPGLAQNNSANAKQVQNTAYEKITRRGSQNGS